LGKQRMKGMDEILNKIGNRMQELDSIREKSLSLSRDIILSCRKCIQSIHNRDFESARKSLNSASRKLRSLYKLIENHSELQNAGYVENAAQEYVEAKCVYNLERNKPLPDPDDMKISYVTFLLGLCDTIGELRRFSLDAMKDGDVGKANRYLDMMEKIYASIMNFDYPPALKRKQDIARSLIEKTKSELAVASCEKRIQDKIEEFRGFLDEVERERNKRKKKLKKDIDLDIDKVW